jgi:hypothetical protein
MYLRSTVVSKLSALLPTLAVLFLFLPEQARPAADNVWGEAKSEPIFIPQGNYPQIQPGQTYDPSHVCSVDHNGPAVNCVPGMPVPIILYEFKDPSLIPACGAPVYPFQVDGVAVELCNPEVIPCTLWVVAQVYDLVYTSPNCPVPGNLLCQSEILMIVVPPTGADCIEFDLPISETCCVNGPYFAAVSFLQSSCPPAVGPCLDAVCDTCHSYHNQGLGLVENCQFGFSGNWRICSWGRTFGQNDCAQDTCWYYKKGYPDYAPYGVPDFDQKQDGWVGPMFAWTHCGPVAVANCLWWFDSKFDSLSPAPPPAVHDKYPLVKWMNTMPPVLDDHDSLNVIPLVDSLAKCMQTGPSGTNVFVMESCLVKWLKAVNLHDDYVESTFFRPEFDRVEREVQRSQDVILLLGFYDLDCRRIGGHFVTMAGVCSDKMQIAISDPYFDKHEGNPPGPPAHLAWVHNDAALVSGPHGTNLHDIYQAVPLMPGDPCFAWGSWELIDYPDSMQYVFNFERLNQNPLNPNQPYNGGPLRTIVEFAVDVSPESCIALPGDANSSNTITLGDAISIVNYIFNKPGWPPCPSASNMCWLSDLLCRGDANGDASVTLADVIYLVNYIFNKPGGPWFPIPNGKCCLKLPNWPLRR